MDIKKILLVKSFKKITEDHGQSQSQQETQATDTQEDEIVMSVNLP